MRVLATESKHRVACRCGVVSDRWIRGQGPWFGFWYAVGYPLVTAGLYVLLVLGAIRGPDVSSTVRVLLGSVPLVILAITGVVQFRAGHRGACLFGRSLYWWMVWPGALLLGFAVNAPIPVLDRRGHGSGGQTDSPQPSLTDSPYSAPSDREPGS